MANAKFIVLVLCMLFFILDKRLMASELNKETKFYVYIYFYTSKSTMKLKNYQGKLYVRQKI